MQKKSLWEAVIKYTGLFILTIICLVGILVLSAMIPKTAIQKNMQESALYLTQHDMFITMIDGIEGSKIDHHADAVLLNIAWNYDSVHPLKTTLLAPYYHMDTRHETTNLFDSVFQQMTANSQYLRYWHGSNAIVRPLLTIINIEQIYQLNGFIMLLLFAWLSVILVKNKAYFLTAGIISGAVLTSAWFVPLSLEYTWTYLLMLITSITSIYMIRNEKWDFLNYMFFLCGILTNYLDFLTTELLTLAVPMLIIIWFASSKNKPVRDLYRNSFVWAILWGIGYCSMWITKWVLTCAVFKKNVIPEVIGHIEERINGNIGIGLGQFLIGTFIKNIKCLIPFEYGKIGFVLGCACIASIIYYTYKHLQKSYSKECIALYFCIGMLPYIRYLVMHNHSYLHYFFTYRAQMITIVALVLIIEEFTRKKRKSHGTKRKRKS